MTHFKLLVSVPKTSTSSSKKKNIGVAVWQRGGLAVFFSQQKISITKRRTSDNSHEFVIFKEKTRGKKVEDGERTTDTLIEPNFKYFTIQYHHQYFQTHLFPSVDNPPLSLFFFLSPRYNTNSSFFVFCKKISSREPDPLGTTTVVVCNFACV